MQDTNFIEGAINSNRQMYQNLSKSGALSNKTQYSSTNKIQYYNDEIAIKKEKKKKLHKKIIAVFTGVSIAAIATTTIISLIKKKNIDLFDAIKSLRNGVDLKKFGVAPDKVEEIEKKAKGLVGKSINASINFGSIRDDYLGRAVEKTEGTPFGFIKKSADWLEKLYNKWAKDGSRKTYCIAKDKLQSAIGKDINISELCLFDEFFDDVDKITKANLTKKGQRITNGLFGSKGKRPKLKELLDLATRKPLADEKISKLYSKYLLDPDEIIKYLPNDANKIDATKAVKEYNKAIQDTIERLRDTNIGNPISDALGIIISLGGLGASLITAEDDKERKSISINLGIPIITTVSSIIIGSAKCFSSVKSMIFGGILGVFGSTVAKIADNATKGKPTDLNSIEV